MPYVKWRPFCLGLNGLNRIAKPDRKSATNVRQSFKPPIQLTNSTTNHTFIPQQKWLRLLRDGSIPGSFVLIYVKYEYNSLMCCWKESMEILLLVT